VLCVRMRLQFSEKRESERARARVLSACVVVITCNTCGCKKIRNSDEVNVCVYIKGMREYAYIRYGCRC